MQELVIALLCALIVYQQWFWARQNQRLVDKVMSRNYAEYHAVQQAPAVTERGILVPDPLEDLNTLQGFGSPI